MKFLSILLTVTLLAITAGAQTTFTNGVKISALVNANTPLTGSEVIVVDQSGVTKATTVSQVNNAPMNALASTNTILAAAISATAASQVTASNALQAQITANATTATTASNTLQTLIAANTARDTATTNGLQTQISANATTAAAANLATSNAILFIANAAAAQATQTGVTNGGNGNFGNVTYGVQPYGGTGSSPLTIDLSRSSFQTAQFTNKTGNCYILINTNTLAAGQNVTIAIQNNTGTGTTYYFPNYNFSGVGYYNLSANANSLGSISTGQTVVFNFQSFGGSVSNLFFSYAKGN